MNSELSSFPESWPRPERRAFQGRFVALTPLEAQNDAEELFSVSHGTTEVEKLWRYLPYGPFSDVQSYRAWLERTGIIGD